MFLLSLHNVQPYLSNGLSVRYFCRKLLGDEIVCCRHVSFMLRISPTFQKDAKCYVPRFHGGCFVMPNLVRTPPLIKGIQYYFSCCHCLFFFFHVLFCMTCMCDSFFSVLLLVIAAHRSHPKLGHGIFRYDTI